MKKTKLFAVIGAAIIAVATAPTAAGNNRAYASELVSGARAAYLMDFGSGQCAYAFNEHDRMPIASVCKVMTLTLCLDAVEAGELSMDDEIYVSENSAGMGGSQIFLECGNSYPLRELVKSIVVCSANDSCVAVAEKISGSEEQFVADMNGKAAELGLKDTLFANCTGLPRDTQYSCAADVAVMFANLIRHEEYFEFSKIWLEDFVHQSGRSTTMTNTNKLIRRYAGCDGGKTGFTSEAGYCLAATAKKGNMRLISVVLGSHSSDERFSGVTSLFDYGFANYSNKVILDKSIALSDKFDVRGGKKPSCTVFPAEDSYIFCKRGEQPEVEYDVKRNAVKAPVSKGQKVGTIEIYRDGVLYSTVDAVSGEDVAKAGYGDRLKEVADGWSL